MSIPYSGIKKPLNLIEGPEYPNIKQQPILFKNTRKFWKVDIGDVLKETEKYPMFVESIIEYQSRNRNETIYGKSSHRDYVNESIRYPLISPWDYLPLSRKPRLPVTPRVNPVLVDLQLSTENMLTGLGGHLTDRVKSPVLTTYR